MPIRWTSRLSLATEVDRLPKSRRAVYAAIRDWNPASDGPGPSIEDIATRTGMKEHSVSGRVNELKHGRVIAEGPLKLNNSGKHAMTYIALGYREDAYTYDVNGQGNLFSAAL